MIFFLRDINIALINKIKSRDVGKLTKLKTHLGPRKRRTKIDIRPGMLFKLDTGVKKNR